MVSLIVGFPGSGKSYKAVHRIYEILSNEKKKEFEVIYTNIGGIKFDYFPNSDIEFKKLKEEDLLNYLQECFKLYEQHKNEENVDEYLITYSKEKGYYKALIVFDECHDFFSNQDRVKIFWLTYHRHLHHEIILLTQNKSLINSKYRAIPEQFIEAQPRSKKIFSNTLNYKHYAAFAMRKQDLFKSSSLKTSQEIFNLYQSGNKSNQKSIILKFIFILGIGFIIAALLFLNLFNSFQSEDIQEQQEKTQTTPIKENTPQSTRAVETIDKDNDYVIKVLFDSREGYYIYDEYYSVIHFKKFLKNTDSKILSKYSLISNKQYKLSQIYIRTNEQSLKQFFILPKEKENKTKLEDINLNL